MRLMRCPRRSCGALRGSMDPPQDLRLCALLRVARGAGTWRTSVGSCEMRGGGVPRNRVPSPNAACVAIAQPRARCLTLAMRMAKTYARGVFLDSGASASIMSQGDPKALGSRSPVDWVPASGFASRLRRNLGRNLRPHRICTPKT